MGLRSATVEGGGDDEGIDMGFHRGLALLGALLILPALAACGGSSAESSTATEDAAEVAAAGPVGGGGFVGPEWKLATSAVDSIDLSTFGITIVFTDTDVSGMSGVNTYAGGFTSSPEGAMDFDPLISTRMAGPEDAMQAEQAYLAALDTITGYSVTDTELDLFVGEQAFLTYTK
jgi:heat shock protein HslJ